ncbi:transcriptional repressor CTCF-like [Cheilinus undulatus]|uniref:transcriptional repressor CTCF-like n=1 Tax=Cheilinus undulatus TaxID=241271 RepID=UPI001BD34C66|nr:transcriptional repressor CTCF-like [Cheilinus undulatus]
MEEEKEGRTEEEKVVEREESTQEEKEAGKEVDKEEKDGEMGEGEKETLKRKRSSEAEDDVECHDEGPTLQKPVTVKTEAEGDESVLVFDGAGYRCLICNWRSSKKGPGINHVVRKHDIPRAYAHQSLRQHLDSTLKQSQGSGGAEEEEGAAGLTGEMLKEEMEVVSKVVRFIASRFVCLICGWKTKLKGFAISHVERSHDVERPYSCKICKLAFFLPSRMQQHVSTAHRPGRYACPFCCFRSEYLGGFRRHCSRCNAREEGEEDGGGEEGEEGNEEDEVEEVKETRRKRRRVVKVMKEEDTEDEDEEDD